MKKVMITVVFSFFAFCLKAQTTTQTSPLELNVYGGYNFRDKVELYDTYAYVNDGFQYGGGLEYYFDRISSLELKYLRMDATVPLYKYGGNSDPINPDNNKASLNYILVDGNYYWDPGNAKALPFTSAGIGVGIVDAKNGSSVTKFAWDLKLGVKVKTASALSFKLQAYLQSIVGGYGGGFYAGTGGVIVGTSYSYVSVIQFGLGGALCFGFKSKK
jgi:hypothetical protein